MKRKLRIDRLIILFVIVVIITISFIVIINKLFFPSVYYNYEYERMNDLENLKTHDYNFDNLYQDGQFFYYEDDNYTSSIGIDVSSHQGDIDWQMVKESGIEFAYIRLGFRGYGTGEIVLDEMFEQNYAACKEVGIKVGVYFFSQAISEEEAMEEAFFVLEHILDKEIDLPIVYDLEEIDYDESRVQYISSEQRSDNAMAFAQKAIENNYEAMIYTNLYWALNYFDLNQILHYDIWYAQYNDVPDFNYPFKIWQYSDSGQIDGIEFPVDLNIIFIPK